MLTRKKQSRPVVTPPGDREAPYGDVTHVLTHMMAHGTRQARWGYLREAILVGLVLVLGISLAAVRLQSTVAVHVVEVDTLGQVHKVGETEVPYVPTDVTKIQQIQAFLLAIRALSTDAMVVRKQWEKAFDMVTQQAAERLRTYGQERAFDTLIGKQAITVEMLRTLRLSDVSYDVSWRETYYRGQTTADEYWSGIVTLVLQPPTTTDEIRKNPLGIWIDDWQWSKQ